MKKTTRRALFLSFASMFLCFTMLLGTTYAWFTDSVESGVNQIVAGNLDVELWNDNVQITGANNDPELFDKVTKWEPGAMAWENLTVKNVGDLAFKYQLSFDTTAVGSEDLREVVKVAIVEGGIDTNTDTRDTLKSLNFVKFDDLDVVTGAITKEDASQEKTYGVVLYWAPSDIDNDYNMNNGKSGTPLSINVYVNLYATQVEAEDDSFGSDYDEDAWHEKFEVVSADALQAAINNGEQNIQLVNDIELDEAIVIPAPAVDTMSDSDDAIVIDLNGNTITAAYNETTGKHSYAIDNYGSLVIVGGTIEARGIYNRDGATTTVNGTKIVNLDMNGGSCIWSYGGSVYLNNATLVGYTGCVYSEGYLEINGGTYTCYSAVTDDGEQIGPTYNIRSFGELVINGGDFTSRHGLLAIEGDAEINGGTYTMTSIGVITSHVFYVSGDSSNVVVNDGAFNCDLRTAQNNGSSMICVDAANVAVNVYGGTFNLTPAKYVAEGYKVLETENGWEIFPDNYYVATTLTEVMKYAKTSGAIIDAKGANLGDFNYDGTFAEGVVLKNAKFTYVYGASVDGVATFENCEFVSNHSYCANFSDGSFTGKVIFNNCYFDGWSSFGDAITYVEMNNCTFDWNNPYSMLRFYQNAQLNGCNFVNIDGIDTNKTGTVVEFNNCTGIEGKIYNNGSNVGTWIVDGEDISNTVTAW